MFMESREARVKRKELNKRRAENEDEEDEGILILVLKDSRSKVALAKITKVPGTVNLADALTKYCDVHVTKYHLEHTSQHIGNDRHKLMPTV